MAGRFPYQNDVSLRLTVPEPTRMKLRVRVPGWATADMTIEVNGKRDGRQAGQLRGARSHLARWRRGLLHAANRIPDGAIPG